MEVLQSEGKCMYCNLFFSQKEIRKHLENHLAEKEKTDGGNNTQTYCHIEVEANEMFLHLLVKAGATIKTVDSFLRGIWLECCGHLSAFRLKNSEIKMSSKVQDVFIPSAKIFHDYDFGTTTRILLKGMKHYQLDIKDKIVLLSRNEPLKLLCSVCKKEPATYLCSVCCWKEDSFFCEKCSKKHQKVCADFEDYSCMSVVNSPRMGECDYTGGSIDKERDGHYKVR